MDLVGGSLILTFGAMLVASGLAMPRQRPPVERRRITCPEDHQAALVLLDWDAERQCVRLLECDHRTECPVKCRERCAGILPSIFGQTPVSRVLG
ncbi:hypothetical protein [Candidatus Nitrospira bockiana]